MKIITHYVQFLLVFLIVTACFEASAQQSSVIRGVVKDKQSGEPLPGTNIRIKGTVSGTVATSDGTFELSIKGQKSPVLVFSFVGYATRERIWQNEASLEVLMEPSALPGDEVIVSASRLNQDIRQSPIAIQKVEARQIETAASGDYFNSLSNLRDVEIISNSIGFSAFNTRGFNSTSPLRVVQFIDGVDNQLPTINIATGNMFGISDIDIDNLEIISGPASALYGANAMQGVISFTSKSAFDKQGVTAELKMGTQNLKSMQVRFADVYGKNNRLGLKFTASHMNANDWIANNPVANRYGKQSSPPQNLNQLITTKAQSDEVFQDFIGFAENNPSVMPGVKPFNMPGYLESDLWDGKINNTKISGTLNYKISDALTATYNYRYATGTSIYMGNNRAPLDGFFQQLHYLGLNGKHYHFKAYRSNDDTRGTYAMNATGTLLGFASLPSVTNIWTDTYVNQLANLTNNFTEAATQAMIDEALAAATTESNNGWLVPGTSGFDAAKGQIIKKSPPVGSNFSSKTMLYHAEFGYNRSYKMFDFNFGASYRYMSPDSKGTVFADTLQKDSTYRKISMNEYAAYLQAITNLPANFKILASFRVDKNEYYAAQLSPRLALTWHTGEHYFRLSGQSAFRSPVLSDLFQHLNKGSEITLGNVDGISNIYTLSSVNAYLSSDPKDASLLKPITLDAVKPEQLQSIELGYNGTLFEALFADFSVYYNMYKDFIVYQSVVRPKAGVAGEASGEAAIAARNSQRYAVSTNSSADVSSLGFSTGFSYYVSPAVKSYVNYTFANIDSSGIAIDQIPGFNTPKHKINMGLSGQKVVGNFGFNLNFRWVDNYYWGSVFVSGPVPSYNTMDIQLNYTLPNNYLTFKIGGANVYNNKFIQAYGMPEIGAFYYFSLVFDRNFDR